MRIIQENKIIEDEAILETSKVFVVLGTGYDTIFPKMKSKHGLLVLWIGLNKTSTSFISN